MSSAEHEVTYRVCNPLLVRARLIELAGPSKSQAAEHDVLLDFPDRRLDRAGFSLQLRFLDTKTLLSVKGPRHFNNSIRGHQEYETWVADGTATAKCLEFLGLSKVGEYVKVQESWTLDDVTVSLDLLECGTFLKIKGPQDQVQAVSLALGLSEVEVERRPYNQLSKDLRDSLHGSVSSHWDKPLNSASIADLAFATPFPDIQPLKRGPGETLPWEDVEFSRRMLKEHLDQSHEQASRPRTQIQEHVNFLIQQDLLKSGMKVLDLGCGPGLYAEAMAQRLAVQYIGIDKAPAAVAYALRLNLPAGYSFILGDFRDTQYPAQCGLITMFYEVFNFLSDSDAELILRKACQALEPDGTLFLELVPRCPTTEYSSQWFVRSQGLFADVPHLELVEQGPLHGGGFWGHRHFIYTFADGQLREYRNFLRIYQPKEIKEKAHHVGMELVGMWGDFAGSPFDPEVSSRLIVALRKKGG